jgi:hypothetical protein
MFLANPTERYTWEYAISNVKSLANAHMNIRYVIQGHNLEISGLGLAQIHICNTIDFPKNNRQAGKNDDYSGAFENNYKQGCYRIPVAIQMVP